MNLFKNFNESKIIQLDALTIETPIGNILFNMFFSGRSLRDLEASSTKLFSNNVVISSWNLKDCQVEFMRLNIVPHLPQGMKVSECLSGMWRLKAFENQTNLSFECRLNYQGPKGAHDLEIDPESGEYLAALTWEVPFIRLTIGTEDEESLQQRAQGRNWLPYRFKDLIDSSSIIYLKDGIKIMLPPLFENESVQIHFNVAWTYREIATWFAVDESSANILKQANVE